MLEKVKSTGKRLDKLESLRRATARVGPDLFGYGSLVARVVVGNFNRVVFPGRSYAARGFHHIAIITLTALRPRLSGDDRTGHDISTRSGLDESPDER